MRIGIISDTHGLLRPEALNFLRGCAQIIHAGDVGNQKVLDDLAGVAPVTAVRGNNDKGVWANALSETEFFEVGGCLVYLIHDLNQLDIEPRVAGVGIVISGHTHVPKIEERDGVIFINPGAAGPRRFSLPVSIADLTLTHAAPKARLIDLLPRPPSA